MNQPVYPPYGAGPQNPAFGQGFPQPQMPQQPYPQQPQMPQQPPPGYYPPQQQPQYPGAGYGQPPGQPVYAPGYQPLLPQQPPRANGPQADVDSAGDEGTEYPKPTVAGGLPWYLSVVSCSEFPSYYKKGSNIFCINAEVRQSPDPNFTPGMRVSVLIKGLNDTELNNKAQGRLKGFLAAACNESTQGQAPGHFAGRKEQAVSGQLTGAPFAVSFTQRTAQTRNKETGQFNTYLTPAFQPG